MPETIVISVSPKDQKKSARRKEVQHLLSAAGHRTLQCLGVSALYKLEGNFTRGEAETVARELLWDAVAENFALEDLPENPRSFFVDVWFKPGVADPAGESVLKAIRDLEITGVSKAFTGSRYEFSAVTASLNGKGGPLASDFASRELLNPLIQECECVQAEGSPLSRERRRW